MAKTIDERLSNLSVKLADLSQKAATASEDARIYKELRKEAIEDRINTAKGNVAAMQAYMVAIAVTGMVVPVVVFALVLRVTPSGMTVIIR